MGFFDKLKDALGLGEKKEEKEETKTKKGLSEVEKFRKIENIVKNKSKAVDNGNAAVNRKKHRRALLEEAK